MLGSLRARLINVAYIVRTLGVRQSLTVVPAWLVTQREFVAVAWPVPPDAQEIPARPGVRCTVLDEATLPAFRAQCPELTAHEIRRRWAAGLECMILWQDSAVTTYRWDALWSVGPVYFPYLRRFLRLAPGDSLVYDTRTLPSSRRLRLGAELVSAAVERARWQGASRLVGLIAAWNRASLGWAEHLGWQRLGTVGYRRVGLRHPYFATGSMAIVDGEIGFPPRDVTARDPSDLAPDRGEQRAAP
jgi:GNAT superfamily N-acetyltransferase